MANSTPGTGALASIYSDDGVTSIPSSTVATDSQGRYDFYAADAKYDLTFTGTGVTTYVLPAVELADVTQAGPGTADLGWFTHSLNNILYVGSGITKWGTGDIGSQINAAYAALPTTGGEIRVLGSSSAYSFSTAINFSTANKPVILRGVILGTQLTYSGSGTAFTFNCTSGAGVLHARGFGLRDLYITGSGSGTGLLLGGTNGAEGFKMDGVYLSGFDIVALYSDNTWGTSFHNSIVRNGATNLLKFPATAVNSGEALSFVGCTFIQDSGPFANAILLSGSGTDANFVNCSFDQCQMVVTAGVVDLVDPHMEWLTSQSTYGFVVQTGWMKVSNLNFTNDAAGTTAPAIFQMTSGGQLRISGGNVTSPGGYTFPAIAALSGTGNFEMYGVINIAGFTTPVTVSSFTGTYIIANRNSTNDLMVWEGNGTDVAINIRNDNGSGQEWAFDSLNDGTLSIFPRTTAKVITFATSAGIKINGGNAITSAGAGGTMASLIASGTATMTTALIATLAAGTTVTVAATGVAATDAIQFSFNAAITNNPGNLIVHSWVTANNVNFAYFNPTAGGITPNAATLNWRVVR